MTLKHLLGASCLALSLSLAACQPAADKGAGAGSDAVSSAQTADQSPTLGTFGVALENMDKSVKPEDWGFLFCLYGCRFNQRRWP